MARVTRITIGETNFNDTAVGFVFKHSVCDLGEEVIDESHFRIVRLCAIFPGTVVETVDTPKVEQAQNKPVEQPKPQEPVAPAPEIPPEIPGEQRQAEEEDDGADPFGGDDDDEDEEPEAKPEKGKSRRKGKKA